MATYKLYSIKHKVYIVKHKVEERIAERVGDARARLVTLRRKRRSGYRSGVTSDWWRDAGQCGVFIL